MAFGIDSRPAFKMPQALFPDNYKKSTLPKVDHELKPRDQSILLFCWALQGMAELNTSGDGITPNWRYGDLSQATHYVRRGLKCHTEVTNTMVSTFFPCNLLIGWAEEVLRAAYEICEAADKESVITDAMGSCGCSDTDMSPTTPVTLRSTCASDTKDSYDVIQMDVKSGLDIGSGLDILI